MENMVPNLFVAAATMNDSQWDIFIQRCLRDQAFLLASVEDIYPPSPTFWVPSSGNIGNHEEIDVDEMLILQELMQEGCDSDDAMPQSCFEPSGGQPGCNNHNNHENEDKEITKQSKGTNFTIEERTQVITKLFLLADNNYRLPKKTIANLADNLGKHRTTLNRIWEAAVRAHKRGEKVVFRDNKHKCGRKRKDFDEDVLKAVPQSKRTTIRQFAGELDVSSSTIVRLMKKGVIRSHTSSIKPTLKPHHKIARLEFVLKKIIPKTMFENAMFESLTNIVHIDEKNFMGSRQTQRYYLVSEESEPYRHTQSKNFIEKVMFMAAVARPLFGRDGECVFDGKIGIWPFTEDCIAMRTSSNRPKGTIVTKPARSVTKETIRSVLISKLLPALKAKWPSWQTKCIWIQQDNARPHISPDDMEFRKAANSDGFEIQLINQPAQSPDLNILDLGFFNAIQSLQYKKFPKNVTELIKAVEEAYFEYDPRLIKFTWLQLQYVMIEILKSKGGNEYKSPHIGKEKLEKIGKLPFSVEVSQELIDSTVKYLESSLTERSVEATMPDEVPGYKVF